MKKAFSFVEVIITTMLLSVVMVSLLQIKSDNIFLVNKSNETKELKDYILIASDLSEVNKKNENIFLNRIFNVDNDEIRRELKSTKVKIKDKKLDTLNIENDNISVGITTYVRTYSIKDDIKKNIYSFKLEL